MLRPKTSMVPACGSCRPRMVCSRTDLPAPEPPTMPMISLRRTSNDKSLCTTWVPNRFTRPRTRTTRSSSGVCATGSRGSISEVDLLEQDGEERVRKYHEENRLHDRHGGQPPELARRIAHLHAAVRTDHADEQREHRRLHHARPERRRRQRFAHPDGELRRRDVQLDQGQKSAARK